MRTILMATIITHLLYGCSSNTDNVEGSTGNEPAISEPTIVYTKLDNNEKVSVISSFVISTKDDLSAVPEGEAILRMQALDFSQSDGYLAANYFDHRAIAEGINCDACHGESALAPEIIHYVTKAIQKTISGKISIDGDTITFRPDSALEYGRHYELSILPVTDINGQQLRPFTFNFSTHENPQIKVSNYSKGILTNYNQTIAGISSDDIFRIEYDAKGEITSYRRMVINKIGKISESIIYIDPGDDNNWFFSDDNGIGNYLSYDFNSIGIIQRATEFTAGPDMKKGSADDEIVHYSDFHFSSKNEIIALVNYNHPGANGVWLDEDDQVTADSYIKIERSIENQDDTRRIIVYKEVGDDGLWYTGDDIIASYREIVADTEGNDISSTNYNNNGATGIWFDDTDLFSNYTEFAYYANGLLNTKDVFDGKNNLKERETFIYDELNRIDHITQEASSAAGVVYVESIFQYNYLDETGLLNNETYSFFDQKQTMLNIRRFQYDYDLTNGRLKTAAGFNGGADNDLSTVDDNVITYSAEY